LETKIIGGKYKGKKIKLPPLSVTRSSKSILRESLFNTLQQDIAGKNLVEVFAGSGSIGLEAISRGAKKVFFIEKNHLSFKILTENLKKIDASKGMIFLGDAFEKLFLITEILKKQNEKAYFYFDPPFMIREENEDIYQKIKFLIRDIPEKIVIGIIIEHMSSFDFGYKIGKYVLNKKKKFGKSSISFYGKEL
jgi:16S rRNA (guanine(966)-N(2))-methyltransferase RsmD